MRVLVTGCSGRLGDAVTLRLLANPLVRRVAGIDVRPPRRTDGDRFRYHPADIRDGVYLRSLLEEEGIDAVYHLAFKARESADPLDAETVNVDGTLALLEAASKSARVRKAVLLSSAYAYGARRRKAPLIDEAEPLAASGRGPAAWRRRMEERVGELLPDLRPTLQVSMIRACAIAGGGHEASCPALPFLKSPLGPLTLAVADPPLQCLALEEAALALARIVEASEFRGAYNLAPDDTVRLGSLCREVGGRRLRVPYPLLWPAARLARRFAPALGLSEATVEFLAHGVAVDNHRIKQALGIEFRVPSREAFAALIQ